MFIIETYTVAVIFCIVTMLCWGSWANTQKLAEKTWRFELYYWDYVLGVVILSLLFGFTLGSMGDEGRGFVEDLAQADLGNIGSAFLGGVIFNLANILIVMAIAVAGMAVAFPVGIGLALVLGVLVNYIASPSGDAFWLFFGVALVTTAIILDSIIHKRVSEQKDKVPARGILLAIAGGVIMSFFYYFVARSMSLNFSNPEAGLLTPYTAVFVFSIGILVSNFLFNTYIMKRPIDGAPVSYSDYFNGSVKEHLIGILGGIIWGVGMSFSIIAAEMAGFAISYGLGQGATLVAALWGVFVWKEFKEAPEGTNKFIVWMFIFFFIGLSLIVYAGL